jgi:DNA polymerase III delta prime subunit
MDINAKEYLWVQKYRPRKISDCILPKEIKKIFNDFVSSGEIPNFLLAGTAGTGKTTIAYALCEEIKADVLYINASLENGIDILRYKISQFASTVSFGEGIKVVILDEADHLNANSTQPALRGFIEEFSSNCRFIFTCNTPSRIIEPLHSRCCVVTFKIPKEESQKLQVQIFKRINEILENEGVEYDKAVVAELIQKHFPDFRRTINELQRYSVSGKIDEGIFANLSEDSYDKLNSYLKEKKFTDMRNWVSQNISGNGLDIIDRLYQTSSEVMIPNSIPQLIMILNEAQKNAAFCANAELNITACLTEIMSSCQYK